MMTPHKKWKTANFEKAIAALVAAGFEPAGTTATEHVKFMVATGHGYPGFKGATFGGRARFAKPGTTRRATVGKVTTAFYEVVNGKTVYGENVPTRETARIAEVANAN